MATFTQNIETIRNARYGKDVRESIANGLEQCYDAEREFDNAYRNAITELDERIEEATADAVSAATADAVQSAKDAVTAQQTASVNAVNSARDAAIQSVQQAAGTDSITLTTLGVVYSATEPANPTTGMVWLKPVS